MEKDVDTVRWALLKQTNTNKR